MYTIISIKNLSLSYLSNILFEDFSVEIFAGDRIAIVGRNGSGKSTLLKVLARKLVPEEGELVFMDDLEVGYVEQTIDTIKEKSGGERFNKRLSEEIAKFPDILLLDEPTNHLDTENRRSLMKMLQRFHGTLIVVSHDKELLDNCVDTIWHVEDQKVVVFHGRYEDYRKERRAKRGSLQKKLEGIHKEAKETHIDLMKEQKRAAKSKAKGKKGIENKKWPTVVSNAKASRAQETSGKKKASIQDKKERLKEELQGLHLPKEIVPTFLLPPGNVSKGEIVSLHDATIGYCFDQAVLENVSFTMNGDEKVAIEGKMEVVKPHC